MRHARQIGSGHTHAGWFLIRRSVHNIPVTMRLLDTAGGRCALASRLRRELLTGSFPSRRLTGRLLGTCHDLSAMITATIVKIKSSLTGERERSRSFANSGDFAESETALGDVSVTRLSSRPRETHFNRRSRLRGTFILDTDSQGEPRARTRAARCA